MVEGQETLDQVIVIGDRVLIKPKKHGKQTKGGLYLPPNVSKKEKVHSGYVMKVGPGHPIPLPIDENEQPWKEPEEKTKYVPLQAREGDLAVYLQKQAYEIEIEREKYVIVAHSSLLMLFRDEGLFE